MALKNYSINCGCLNRNKRPGDKWTLSENLLNLFRIFIYRRILFSFTIYGWSNFKKFLGRGQVTQNKFVANWKKNDNTHNIQTQPLYVVVARLRTYYFYR